MIVLLAPNTTVNLPFLFILIKKVWIYVYECLVCMDVPVTYACLVPLGVRRQYWSPGAGIRDGCKLPHRCWELLTPGPLQEQQALLTSESSLQSLTS